MSTPDTLPRYHLVVDEGGANLQRCHDGELCFYSDVEKAAFTEPELKMLRTALSWLNRHYVLTGADCGPIESLDLILRAALSEKGET